MAQNAVATTGCTCLRICVDIPGVEIADRVTISPGTCAAAAMIDDGADAYVSGALVPLQAWRPLRDAESRALSSARSAQSAAMCWIISVPQTVLAKLWDLGVQDVDSPGAASAFFQRQDVQAAFRRVELFARSLLVRADGFRMADGLGVRAPGLTTTTVDTRLGRRIGLHVDTWDQLSVHDRALARNRLNMNLGKNSRYLLLVDTRVDAMYATTSERAFSVRSPLDATGLAREFLRQRSTVPVYRLTVEPGEAYIAPTDLVPHDSTTLGLITHDVSFSALGYFAPGV